MTNKFNILTSFHAIAMILVASLSQKLSSQDVTVFAGIDTSICQNDALNLLDLNAEISGAVNDGFWFTTGDGFFDPGTSNNVQFSIGSSYIPGPNDIVAESFSLILASLDPDGNGPAFQVNDTVNINLTTSPALVCHGSLNVSLGDNCTELVTAEMVVTNPKPPFSQYIISLTDENGDTIPNNTLTVDHLNETITFNVGHLCGNNSCWGTILPQDKKPPILTCGNLTIDCENDTSPDSLGFPIPQSADVEKITSNSYNILHLDACSDVLLTFSDSYQDMSCLNDLQERIIRRWTATDASGNSSMCTQVISVLTKGISEVVLPPHYNDNPTPSLECNGNWPKLQNGNPSPTYTGQPQIDGCKYLEMTYTDLEFELCGNAYKILRKWLIVDWCTNETFEYNQVIKIHDTTPPAFNVTDSLTFYTTAYDCHTSLNQIPPISNLIDCSEVDTFFQLRDTFNNHFNHHVKLLSDTFYIDSLPVGHYIGSYIVKDECENRDTNKIIIDVIDNKAPFAICDHFTKVSIIINGTARMFAESLDDNSIDNCMIDSFSIAKMTDLCQNQANIFKPYVDFCCEETAQPVLVALKVTDIYGNENTCMAEVTIEDKEAPQIVCPSDITVDCEFDYSELSVFGSIASSSTHLPPIIINDEYNNGIAGTYGYALDNCMLSLDSVETFDIDCHVGSITRVFTATDLFGNQSSCTQTISVVSLYPFTYNDIMWPADIEIDGCDTSSIDIDLTKEPTYKNDACANVEATYEDQYFLHTQEACIKVLRNWTVIDWCTFDSNTGYGLYHFVQVIKLTNNTPPIISNTCSDTTFCMYSLDCQEENFTYNIFASDDCTEYSKLNFYWEIDENNDGTIDHSGISSNINVSLPSGQHEVYTQTVDQCGNATNCDFTIDAKDCKNPTPYCISNLTTVIMPSSKELTIFAKSFDFDSYDNCTSQENLRFSFTPNPKDSTRVLTCADISNGVADVIMISLYVFDEENNFDFCNVELAIQDNDDVCEDVGNFAKISGQIKTENLKLVKKARIRLESDVDIYTQSKLTDTLGNYEFSDLPSTIPFKMSVDYDGEADQGLSTLDLVILQRHILGIAPITSPYKILAGDANGSKKLNVSDLVAIRKVLLGVTDSFAPDVDNWIFIDENHVFDDPQKPWIHDYDTYIDDLSMGDKTINFVGIKVGDVNGSVTTFDTEATSNRSGENIKINVCQVGDTYHFKTKESQYIDGFQVEMSFNTYLGTTINANIEKHVTVYEKENSIILLGYFPYSVKFDENEILFSVQGENIALNPHTNITPEAYIDEQAHEIQLETDARNEPLATNSIIYVSNNSLFIDSDDINNLIGSIKIFTINGQMVYDTDVNGRREIQIPNLNKGVYIAEWFSGLGISRIKFYSN